jgi:DDE superfamily endonuclease
MAASTPPTPSRLHRNAASKFHHDRGRYLALPPLGLAVWCEDEAGPFQAVPQPGSSWRPRGQPAIRPHEYVRGGTCKVLTLFHPASGQIHLQPVSSCTNAVLHGWLKDRLATILATLPVSAAPPDAAVTRRAWEAWQDGLAERFTLPAELPPLRMLPVWDNLAGHKTAEMVVWLCRHGVMPLYTPLGGSWLNMAESIQRVLKQRTLGGQHPQSPTEIGTWFEQTAQAWNRQPTPFLWNGKRRQRRRRQPGDGHAIGGSAARTGQPISPRRRRHHEWHSPRQVTH